MAIAAKSKRTVRILPFVLFIAVVVSLTVLWLLLPRMQASSRMNSVMKHFRDPSTEAVLQIRDFSTGDSLFTTAEAQIDEADLVESYSSRIFDLIDKASFSSKKPNESGDWNIHVSIQEKDSVFTFYFHRDGSLYVTNKKGSIRYCFRLLELDKEELILLIDGILSSQ